MAALCQMFGRTPSLQVDWLMKPDESKRTTKTEISARLGPKRGKSACDKRLALISPGGQSFGAKRPFILTNGNLALRISGNISFSVKSTTHKTPQSAGLFAHEQYSEKGTFSSSTWSGYKSQRPLFGSYAGLLIQQKNFFMPMGMTGL